MPGIKVLHIQADTFRYMTLFPDRPSIRSKKSALNSVGRIDQNQLEEIRAKVAAGAYVSNEVLEAVARIIVKRGDL